MRAISESRFLTKAVDFFGKSIANEGSSCAASNLELEMCTGVLSKCQAQGNESIREHCSEIQWITCGAFRNTFWQQHQVKHSSGINQDL